MQPSSVIVTLVNVLNPLSSVDFNSMQLGNNSFILPLSIDDGGQNRNFVMPDNIPSGYYLINVLGTFDNNSFNTIYTGKVFIPVKTAMTVVPQQPLIIGQAGGGT